MQNYCAPEACCFIWAKDCWLDVVTFWSKVFIMSKYNDG